MPGGEFCSICGIPLCERHGGDEVPKQQRVQKPVKPKPKPEDPPTNPVTGKPMKY